jgi:hypothetical protein
MTAPRHERTNEDRGTVWIEEQKEGSAAMNCPARGSDIEENL